jgi:hypothetical protein
MQRMSFYISWKHLDTELPEGSPIEKKIEIFQERVWGWQLHVADLLINGGKSHDETKHLGDIPHAGFAALQVMMSYFEMIARYETGSTSTHDSHDTFIRGVLSVFPDVASWPYSPTRNFLNALWADVRCGLYHMSVPKSSHGISKTGSPIQFVYAGSKTNIIIDPHVLPLYLKEHFKKYITRLQNPKETKVREAFEKRFNYDNKPLWDKTPRVVGLLAENRNEK